MNGFGLTLRGLYDWSLSTAPTATKAGEVFRHGMQTIEAILPMFDIDGYSAYDLSHIINNRDPGASPFYMGVHVYVLHALRSIYPSPILEAYEKRWDSKIRELNKTLRFTFLRFSSPSPQMLGTPITINVKSGRDAPPATRFYKIAVRFEGEWVTLQDWPENDKITWTPEFPGEYTLGFYARAGDFKAEFDNYRHETYVIEAPAGYRRSLTLGQIAASGAQMEIAIDKSACSAIELGNIECGATYYARFDATSRSWIVEGRKGPDDWVESANVSVGDPSRNISIFGANATFNSKGEVTIGATRVGQLTTLQTKMERPPLIDRLAANGAELALSIDKLACEAIGLGTISCGWTYQARFDVASGLWVVKGPKRETEEIVENSNPPIGEPSRHISIWGVNATFTRLGAVYIRGSRIGTLAPAPANAPAEYNWPRSIGQAASSGTELALSIDKSACEAIDLGTVSCGWTYQARFDVGSGLWVVKGPHRETEESVENSKPPIGEPSRHISIWGANATFTRLGAVYIGNRRIGTLAPAPADAPAAYNWPRSIGQAASSGTELALSIDKSACEAIDLGTVSCGWTYQARFNVASGLWVVKGPKRETDEIVESSNPPVGEPSRHISIWGANATFTRLGAVYIGDRRIGTLSPAPADAPAAYNWPHSIGQAASRGEELELFIDKTACAKLDLGTIKCGAIYQTRFDTASGTWIVRGPKSGSDEVIESANAPAGDPSLYLSIWGANTTFNRDGDVMMGGTRIGGLARAQSSAAGR